MQTNGDLQKCFIFETFLSFTRGLRNLRCKRAVEFDIET